MTVMNLPPGDADVSKLSGGERRRVALCQLLIRQPDSAVAGRTDQPPGCRKRLIMAGAASGALPGYGRGRDARSLLLGQRRPVDSGDRSRQRDTVRGQLHRLAGSPPKADGGRAASTESSTAHAGPRVGVDSDESEARQAKSKARIKAYEELSAQTFEDRPDDLEIQIPSGRHLGELVIEAKPTSAKSFGDKLLIDDLSFRLAGRWYRRRDRSQWRRQDDAVPHADRPRRTR